MTFKEVFVNSPTFDHTRLEVAIHNPNANDKQEISFRRTGNFNNVRNPINVESVVIQTQLYDGTFRILDGLILPPSNQFYIEGFDSSPTFVAVSSILSELNHWTGEELLGIRKVTVAFDGKTDSRFVNQLMSYDRYPNQWFLASHPNFTGIFRDSFLVQHTRFSDTIEHLSIYGDWVPITDNILVEIHSRINNVTTTKWYTIDLGQNDLFINGEFMFKDDDILQVRLSQRYSNAQNVWHIEELVNIEDYVHCHTCTPTAVESASKWEREWFKSKDLASREYRLVADTVASKIIASKPSMLANWLNSMNNGKWDLAMQYVKDELDLGQIYESAMNAITRLSDTSKRNFSDNVQGKRRIAVLSKQLAIRLHDNGNDVTINTLNLSIKALTYHLNIILNQIYRESISTPNTDILFDKAQTLLTSKFGYVLK